MNRLDEAFLEAFDELIKVQAEAAKMVGVPEYGPEDLDIYKETSVMLSRLSVLLDFQAKRLKLLDVNRGGYPYYKELTDTLESSMVMVRTLGAWALKSRGLFTEVQRYGRNE